jgi:hypothetical protein
MTKPKPVCQAVMPWLKSNLGQRCLAPLTGTDAKALAAAVHIIELYCYNPSAAAITAFRIVVLQMQPSTRHLAFHSIAHVMDWSDRTAIWEAAELPALNVQLRCAFEPGGSARS